jgi:hypothetical protein
VPFLTSRPGVRTATPKPGECLEDRVKPRHGCVGAANHQTVPAFDSPDAPAHARIKVINATRLQRFRAPNVVDVMRVAAVDDYIACLEVRR